MLRSAVKRRGARQWIKSDQLPLRRIRRLIEVPRSTLRYKTYGSDDSDLRGGIKVFAEKYPRYGYPILHIMLRNEGLSKNPKQPYQIYSEEDSLGRTVIPPSN